MIYLIVVLILSFNSNVAQANNVWKQRASEIRQERERSKSMQREVKKERRQLTREMKNKEAEVLTNCNNFPPEEFYTHVNVEFNKKFQDAVFKMKNMYFDNRDRLLDDANIDAITTQTNNLIDSYLQELNSFLKDKLTFELFSKNNYNLLHYMDKCHTSYEQHKIYAEMLKELDDAILKDKTPKGISEDTYKSAKDIMRKDSTTPVVEEATVNQ